MMTEPGSPGAVPVLGASQLLGSLPGLAGLPASPVLHDFRQLPSSALSIEDVLGCPARSPLSWGRAARGGGRGGNRTIEETRFLLDLLHRGDQPVVVTGAMRTRDAAGVTGRPTCWPRSRRRPARSWPVSVCWWFFADEIHAARHVRKAHATSIGAFVSPSSGPVGHVIEGRVRLLARPVRPVVGLPDGAATSAVRVGLVTMALGDDGVMLRAAADAGVLDGLVVAGFGAGHVPPGVAGILSELASGMPVVIASRTGAWHGARGNVRVGWFGDRPDVARRHQCRLLTRPRPGCCCTCCCPAGHPGRCRGRVRRRRRLALPGLITVPGARVTRSGTGPPSARFTRACGAVVTGLVAAARGLGSVINPERANRRRRTESRPRPGAGGDTNEAPGGLTRDTVIPPWAQTRRKTATTLPRMAASSPGMGV